MTSLKLYNCTTFYKSRLPIITSYQYEKKSQTDAAWLVFFLCQFLQVTWNIFMTISLPVTLCTTEGHGPNEESWIVMFRWQSEFHTVCPPYNERCPGQEVKPCHGAGSHCSCDQVKFVFPNLNSNTTSICLETSFRSPPPVSLPVTACLGNMYRVLCLGMCIVQSSPGRRGLITDNIHTMPSLPSEFYYCHY